MGDVIWLWFASGLQWGAGRCSGQATESNVVRDSIHRVFMGSGFCSPIQMHLIPHVL